MATRRVHRPVLTGGHQFPYTRLAALAVASSVSTHGQAAVDSVDNSTKAHVDCDRCANHIERSRFDHYWSS